MCSFWKKKFPSYSKLLLNFQISEIVLSAFASVLKSFTERISTGAYSTIPDDII